MSYLAVFVVVPSSPATARFLELLTNCKFFVSKLWLVCEQPASRNIHILFIKKIQKIHKEICKKVLTFDAFYGII
jgi:hypothetical protein